MAKLNISQTAKLYGKDWKTIKRHVDKGKLSRGSDGSIDTSELIRVYGEPPKNTSPIPKNDNREMPDKTLDHISPKIEELFGLQIKQLEKQAESLQQDKERLLTIIEKQTLLLEYKREITESTLLHGIKRWLRIGMISFNTLLILVTLAMFIRLLELWYGFEWVGQLF